MFSAEKVNLPRVTKIAQSPEMAGWQKQVFIKMNSAAGGNTVILKILQGAFIGVALILPGLSAGTVIVILGFYRQFLDDLSALRFKPYLPMVAGAAGGIIAGVSVISYLLAQYNAAITAFLLGMLLASVPTVLNCRLSFKIPAAFPVLKAHIRFLLLGLAGFIVTWYIICEPERTFTVLPPGGYLHFFLGGTLASATMLLPGVSGSSILIIMNLYDEVIFAVHTWQWPRLVFLAAGFLVGLLGLARLLSALYRRFRTGISFLLAGLILGSTRILLPERFSLVFLLFAAAGALAVLYFTRHSAIFKEDSGE